MLADVDVVTTPTARMAATASNFALAPGAPCLWRPTPVATACTRGHAPKGGAMGTAPSSEVLFRPYQSKGGSTMQEGKTQLIRRRCGAFGCNELVMHARLFCLRHWKLVPMSIRRRVLAHYHRREELRQAPPNPVFIAAHQAACYCATFNLTPEEVCTVCRLTETICHALVQLGYDKTPEASTQEEGK